MNNQQRIVSLAVAIATIGREGYYRPMQIVELATRIEDLAIEDAGFGPAVSPVRLEETAAAVAAQA